MLLQIYLMIQHQLQQYLVLEHMEQQIKWSNLIAYVFAEKKGFSKIGVYTGNNNTNGAFVYTGFKPAFFMLKIMEHQDRLEYYDNERLG